MDDHVERSAPATPAALAAQLRSLRLRAGEPSFSEITRRIEALRIARGVPEQEARIGRVTVYDCFRHNRKRLDSALVLDIVEALGADRAEILRWKSTVDAVLRRANAAAVVWVDDEIPARVAAFVGRESEIAAIAATPGAWWISGMPGVGKSQLAYRAGRGILSRHPEMGVLVADLRGYSAEGPPANPDAVVAALLRAMGVPSRQQPTTPKARVAALQATLRERPRLVILDDAADMAQVRSIITAEPVSPTLVTSRSKPRTRSLGRFTAVPLGVFTPEESLSALAALVGEDRAADEREHAESLLAATGHLPLAVSLTASRVASRPAWKLSDIVDAARSPQRALRLDDALADAFTLSYEAVSEDARALLRLIAVVPVSQFDETLAVALAEGLVGDVTAGLDELLHHHLITRAAPGRFTIHQLLRIHAADVSIDVDPPRWREEARSRLLRNLIDRAWAAHRSAAVAAGEVPRTPRAGSAATAEGPADGDLFATFGELMLSLAHSPEVMAEQPTAAVDFSETLGQWLHDAERFEDALQLHLRALASADDAGDVEGGIRARIDSGMRLAALGRFAEAEGHLRAAVEAGADAYPREVVSLCNTLGVVVDAHGRMQEAAELYRRAIDVAEQIGDRRRRGLAWSNLAGVHLRADRLLECEAALAESAALAEEVGDDVSAARSLVNLSSLAFERQDASAALQASQAAAERFEALGHRVGLAHSCSNVGASLILGGRAAEAVSWLRRGLEQCADGSFPQHAALLHARLAEAQLILGDHADAVASARAALRFADEAGDEHAKSSALAALADCHAADSDPVAARDRWRQVLEICERTGNDSGAAEAREKLAEIESELAGLVTVELAGRE